MKEIISTDKAPKAIGPYSQGVRADRFCFFSGQLPVDPANGQMAEADVSKQTVQVLKNIDALLTSQGLTCDNVVKTTVFLTDMKNFASMNLEYGKYFSINPPARSCVAVLGLPLGALVEIEVLALRES